MDRTKNEDYRSAFFAFLVATALLAVALLLPAQFAALLLPAAVLVVPLILAYTVAGSGLIAGGAAAVLCYAIGSALDYKLSAILAAACLPLALAAGYVIRKKKRFRHSVMITSGAALTGAALVVSVLWLFTGEMPVDFAISRMAKSLNVLDDASIQAFYQMIRYPDLLTGAVTQAALDATSRADAAAYITNQFREWLNLSLVSMIGIYALLMGLLGYLVPRAALKKRRADVIEIPAFSDYALPDRFWLAYLLSYLVAILGSSLGWPGFDILQITVNALYTLVLMVQGLSLLDYLYKRRKMSKGARVTLHAVTLIIGTIVSFIGTLLMWAGLFENIFKVRKRIEAKGGTLI